MVRGIESFRDWFHDYEDQYVIIGGTACDLLMTEEGLDFRATKDIDMVLIIEAVDSSFGIGIFPALKFRKNILNSRTSFSDWSRFFLRPGAAERRKGLQTPESRSWKKLY